MSYRGRPSWPLQWTCYPARTIDPDGEAGVLENVRLSAVNYSFILLTMSCGGDRYISHLRQYAGVDLIFYGGTNTRALLYASPHCRKQHVRAESLFLQLVLICQNVGLRLPPL